MPDVTSIPGNVQETHYSYKIVKFVKEGGNSNKKKWENVTPLCIFYLPGLQA